MLDFLFQRAMEANKRSRTESVLSRNVTSTASLAVKAAERLVHEKVLVLGAGRLGERVVKELLSAKAANISVLNRTLERAEILAAKAKISAVSLSRLEAELHSADVVFCTLSADVPVMTKALLERAGTGRNGRPLLVVDMGVPRNVEVGLEIPGLTIIELDSLVEMSSANADLRAAAVPGALRILDEELHRFGESLVERSAAPTIKSLVARGEQIKRRNIDWARERLPNLSEKELGIVEEMARRMMLGLLQAPIDGLKSDPIAREHRHVVERLFGLEEGAEGG
jgi:glutamyl-tRNA reductase